MSKSTDKKEKPDNAIIGAAGEYLVLSHLMINGFIAAKAPDFTKDYDLFVVNEEGDQAVFIQVKTTTGGSSWVMHKKHEKHEKEQKNLVYCFVKITPGKDGESLYGDSEIFVIDSKIVAPILKMYHQIYTKRKKADGSNRKDTAMRTLHSDYRSRVKDNSDLCDCEIKFLDSHPAGWMDKYRFKPELIGTATQPLTPTHGATQLQKNG